MSKYQVDSGLPIPRGSTGYKYPWKKMEVGDSFFVPKKDGKTARDTGNMAYMSGYAWIRRNNIKHLTIRQRLATENGVEGSRIWLVKKDGVA